MQWKPTNSFPCELITHLKGFSKDCLHQQDGTEPPQQLCSEVATAPAPWGSGPWAEQRSTQHWQVKLTGMPQCFKASWGAAASSSSSLEQQLRVTKHWGQWSNASQPWVMGESKGWPVRMGPQTLCVYLCTALGMERGGTTGLWLQWNPSLLANARQGVKASAIDVVYSDVSLCPTFQFLPHCCPKMSWKMRISTITQTPVESDSCPAPSPFSHGAQNAKLWSKVVSMGSFSKCWKLLHLCWIIFIPFWIKSCEDAMNDISFAGMKRNGVMKCGCQGFLHVTHVWLCMGRMQRLLHEDWKSTCGDTEELMPNNSEPNFLFHTGYVNAYTPPSFQVNQRSAVLLLLFSQHIHSCSTHTIPRKLGRSTFQ